MVHDQPNLTLLTDLYQLTMGQAFFESGHKDTQACFHLFFRRHPFKGNYTVFAGLDQVISYLQNFSFSDDDIQFLSTLKGRNEQPLFSRNFLAYLKSMNFRCDVDAMEEGSLAFPQQPLLRISGPLIQCQLVETALLNMINFQTLIATKACRITRAAQGDPVLEFGLRRAQGIDGGLSASRAAYIGGVAGTSNVLAGKTYNIPVKGTHAHSWVMVFQDELDSFEAYANAMPHNCVFLVDTYDTLRGVENAIKVARRLRDQGHEMLGIRLDSGDLVELSRAARKRLDDAGFPDAGIVASNDLDEYEIEKLKKAGAAINIWGVGTRLVTAFDQPALGGVYKLSALKKDGGQWDSRIKLSEEPIKISNPGFQNVRRYFQSGNMVADVIYDENLDAEPVSWVKNGSDTSYIVPDHDTYQDMLIPLFRTGNLVCEYPNPERARLRCIKALDSYASFAKMVNPKPYPQGLEVAVHQEKARLVTQARRGDPDV